MAAPPPLALWMAILCGVALLTAFGAWYHSLRTYREDLSERSYLLYRYAVPPLMFAVASPMIDVVIWELTGKFPTIGFAGIVLGLVGSGGVLGYVLFDLRWSEDSPYGSGDGETAAESEG